MKDGISLQPTYEQQDRIFQAFVARYPNLRVIARHVRYVHSGSENSLKAFMWYEGHTFESRLFTFTILDRVGGGDAFASGLIYAMLHGDPAPGHAQLCGGQQRAQATPSTATPTSSTTPAASAT